MGSDASKIVREGIITANLTKSAKCIQYLEEQPETDILNLHFKKEQVVVSFIVEHTNATEWVEEVKNQLKEQLEKVFNSVSVLEKISFIQLQETDVEKIDRKRTENMIFQPNSTLHLIDFQILLEHAGQIRYNVSLEESIIKGLEITARIYNLNLRLDTFTGTYNYSGPSNSNSRQPRQNNIEIIQIIPLKPKMPQVEDQRWYSLTAILIVIYFMLIVKYLYSHLDDLKKAHGIVWAETGKVEQKIPIISKILRVYKGGQVIREVTLL